MIEGTVDDSGNVTFTPASSGALGRVAPGVSASVYGTQNVNVRVYTSRATVKTTGPTKTWTMPLGVRNLLPYPIGANQAGVTPQDTLGIFVAFIGGPTVTAKSGNCTAPCTVQLQGYPGTAAFTGPNQPYFYWHERLAAVQPTAGADTVSARKTITFSGPSAITNFTFTMIISAAWPAPNQTFWSVFYNALTDSLPNTAAAPPWKQLVDTGFFGGVNESWSGTSGLTLKTTTTFFSFYGIYLYRADSLNSAESAYIEARLNLSGSNPSATIPQAAFGLNDGAHAATIGISGTRIGFVKDSASAFGPSVWTFTGTPATIPNGGSATALHTYRVRKFGADSVTIEMDGTRLLGLSYSQLPSPPSFLASSSTTFFGVGNQSSGGTATWSYVTYGLGQNQP